MKLDTDSLRLLHSSSTEGVSLTMQRVSTGLCGDHWLSPSQRYRDRGRRRGSNRLRNDLSTDGGRSQEIAEYIGISAPTHSMDGWSLLGRAVHCLLRGDSYSAVHFAYYAELRAALALLASQGIGVYGYPHCIIDMDGCCRIVKPVDEEGARIGTHPWTWLAFQWWAQEPRAIDVLRKVISPNGESLGTWIEAMKSARFALEGIGARWLGLWGIDIDRYFGDRDARNIASYWPNTINAWGHRTAAQNYKAISDIWMPLEPTSEARFAHLDKHLLRIVLSQGYYGASGHMPMSQDGKIGFETEVESLLRNMGMDDSTKTLWKSFLTDFTAFEEPSVIQSANGDAKVGETSHVVEVMSRATMLLRLATGASAALLSDAGIEREDVDFWIQTIGDGRGMWRSTEPPDDLIDLWGDVEVVLDQIDDWMGGDERSMQEVWASESRGIGILGECERVALWGLGL